MTGRHSSSSTVDGTLVVESRSATGWAQVQVSRQTLTAADEFAVVTFALDDAARADLVAALLRLPAGVEPRAGDPSLVLARAALHAAFDASGRTALWGIEFPAAPREHFDVVRDCVLALIGERPTNEEVSVALQLLAQTRPTVARRGVVARMVGGPLNGRMHALPDVEAPARIAVTVAGPSGIRSGFYERTREVTSVHSMPTFEYSPSQDLLDFVTRPTPEHGVGSGTRWEES